MNKHISFPSLDERGITLQTTVITAVLALAAVAAGIVVYNVVSSETSDIADVSRDVLDPFYRQAEVDIASDRSGGEGNIGDISELVDVFKEQDEELADESEEADFVRYEAQDVCMHIEVPYWGSVTSWYGWVQQNRAAEGPANTMDYIRTENNNIVLSPIRNNGKCEYISTAATGITDPAKRIWSPVRSGDLNVNEICESTHKSLNSPPRGSGAAFSYLEATPFCTLSDASLRGDGIGSNGPNWKLVSFCSSPKLNNEGELLVSFSLYQGGQDNNNKCAYRTGTGINDCVGDNSLYIGFDISYDARGYCFVEVSATNPDTGKEITPLLSGDGCLNWKSETSDTIIQGASSGNKCTYSFATSECAALGLKVDGSSCAYEPGSYPGYSNPTFSNYLTTQCTQSQYSISINTGDARCEWDVGDIPPQWLQVCEGWHQVAADEEAADATSPDNTEVFAQYDASRDIYQCVIDNVHYNSISECVSFGYSYIGLEQCAYLGLGYYNPKPIAPDCIVRRLVPYSYAYISDGIALPFTGGVNRGDATTSSEVLGGPPNSISRFQGALLKAQLDNYAPALSAPAPLVEPYPAGNLGVASPRVTDSQYRESFRLDSTRANTLTSPKDGACNYGLQYYEAATEAKTENSGGDTILTITAPRDSAAGRCQHGESSALDGPSNYWLPRYFTGVIATGTARSNDNIVTSCSALSSGTGCGARRSQTKGYYHLDCAVEGSDTNKVLDGSYAKECVDLGFSSGTKTDYIWELQDYEFERITKYYMDDPFYWIIGFDEVTTYSVATIESFVAAAHPDSYLILTNPNIEGYVSVAAEIEGGSISAPDPSLNEMLSPSFYFLQNQSNPNLPQTKDIINFVDRNGISSTDLDTKYRHRQNTSHQPFPSYSKFVTRNGRTGSFVYEITTNPHPGTSINQAATRLLVAFYEATKAFVPQSEAKCNFAVSSSSTEANEIAWLKACRNLDALFDIRLSYYKPVVWGTNADVIKAAVESHYFDSDDSYDTADASNEYSPPSYFHVDTSSTDGQYYCEASPTGSSDTARTQNCNAINAVLGLSPTAVAALGQQSLAVQSSSQGLYENGFFYYEEGPRDHYTCKWKAPSAGNFLV